MEIEKAIERLKGLKANYQAAHEDSFPCLFGKWDRLAESIGSAIEALEKQVEKKPEKGRQEDIFSSRLIGYVCPSCNEFVGVYHTIKKEMTEKSDYCRRCGQKIDWGDE